ncbi:MAG TPA: thermonuclease family protein [Candidatus Atribacteria bacterium]|nr:thermonuclease family protein [Candidatus Atribacteria bacterium]
MRRNRRNSISSKNRWLYYLIIILFLFFYFQSEKKGAYLVARVIDGDTIELSNGEKVRYIGIDTPELHHPQKEVEYYAREAYEANCRLVEGKRVRLELDVEERDRYGRILAYVYVDDLMVNEWLVANGYAHVATFPPNVKYAERFLQLEREARQAKIGLWAD